jgi:hypothetical protein
MWRIALKWPSANRGKDFYVIPRASLITKGIRDHFGEMALGNLTVRRFLHLLNNTRILVNDAPRSATIIATSPTDFLTVEKVTRPR